jgi:hypothetical protein
MQSLRTIDIRTLNGQSKSMYVFPLDTESTARDRVVSKLRSLPRFVSLPNEWFQQSTIEPIDVWDELRQSPDLTFREWIGSYQSLFDVSVLVSLWLTINGLISYEDQTWVRTQFQVDVDRLPRITLDQLKVERNEFVQKEHQVRTFFQQLKETPTDILSSSFTQDRSTFARPFTAQASLGGVFDRLRTSIEFPLLTFQRFYKIHRGFIPEEWFESSMDQIRIATYMDGRLDVITIHETSPTQFILRMTLKQLYLSSFDQLTDTLLAPLNLPELQLQLKPVVTERLGGTFTFPGELDWIALEDLLLNTSPWNRIFAVNDTLPNAKDPGRSRTLTFEPWFYPSENSIYCIVTAAVASGPVDGYPTGTPYWNLRVLSALGLDQIKQFQLWVTYLYQLYQQQLTFVNEWYTPFRPVVTSNSTQRPVPSKLPLSKAAQLSMLDPELFGGQYSRACQPARRIPVVVEDEKEALAGLDNQTVLLFPDDPNAGVQRYYRCEDPEYPFPSVVANAQTTFGYQPCCVKSNPLNSTKFKRYLNRRVQTEESRSVTRPMYMKRTDKPIGEHMLGLFPPSTGIVQNEVARCLESADIYQLYTVVRRGVALGPSSVLDCLRLAMDRTESVEDLRTQLANVSYLPLSKQEMYDWSLDQIQTYLGDSSVYLDPHRTIRLLEEFFDCSLLLFTKNNEYPDGSLPLPRHARGYLTTERNKNRPTILLYIHTGTVSLPLSIPHCELIGLIPRTIDLKTVTFSDPRLISRLPEDHSMIQYMWKLYDQLSLLYIRERQWIPVPVTYPFEIIEQYVDQYGKTRQWVVQFKQKQFTVHTSPHPPLSVPLRTYPSIVPLPYAQAVTWMRQYAIRDTVIEHAVEGRSEFIQGRIHPSVQVTVYIDIEKPLTYSVSPSVSSRSFSFLSSRSPTESPEESSRLSNYRFFQFIARVMTQWSVYLLSQYMETQQLQTLTWAEFMTFITETFIVDSSFTYQRVGELFDPQYARGVLNASGQLVCQSEEILHRLVYQLWLLYRRRPDWVHGLSKTQLMDRYYRTVYDFTPQPDTWLFYYPLNRSESLQELVLDPTSQKWNSTPPLTSTRPVFFKHPAIQNNRMSLIQPVPDPLTGVELNRIWHQQGYNAFGATLSDPLIVSYYLQAIQSNGQLGGTAHIGIDASPNDPTVLVTSLEDQSMQYQAVLPL